MILIIILVSIILYIVNMKKKNYKLKFPQNNFKCKCDLKYNSSKKKLT